MIRVSGIRVFGLRFRAVLLKPARMAPLWNCFVRPRWNCSGDTGTACFGFSRLSSGDYIMGLLADDNVPQIVIQFIKAPTLG